MNDIGNRIKNLREMAKMSQEELGGRIGVQRAAINKYEKGSVTNIPIQSIEKMAKIFDVSPTYIVGWTNENMGKYTDIIKKFETLNDAGKEKVLQYIEDLNDNFKM